MNLIESMNNGFLKNYGLDEDLIVERKWEKAIPKDVARDFRKALNLENVQMKEIIEPTKKVLEWIKVNYPDDESEVEDIEDELYMIDSEAFDFDNFTEDDDDESNQDYFNYILDSLYDLCDSLSIWIPTEGMYEELKEVTNKSKNWKSKQVDVARDRVTGVRDRLNKKVLAKESPEINEAFSDQLPEWLQKAIKGERWTKELQRKLINHGIDLANAEVEVIDPHTLTAKSVKTGIDEQGNVLLLNMSIPGRYGSTWKDNFAYIPGVYKDSYNVDNPRTDKYQQIKYMPAKDIIPYVKDAIIIKPSSSLDKLRADRSRAKKSSIDRGIGQYSDVDRDGVTRWYQTSRQDKSGYPIPDINELFKKITYLTPDNYKERLTYADNKLDEVKEAVKSLLSNPNTVANLFTDKFGYFGDGILRELSDIEENVIKVSKYLDDIRKTADRIIVDGDNVERNFEWLNSDYTSLQRFRSDIREINNDINKLLAKITPKGVEVEEAETVVEESLNEDYDQLYLVGAEDGTDQLIKFIQQIVRKYGNMELTGDIELAIVEDEHGRRLHIQ